MPDVDDSQRLFVRQLLSGRDFAVGNPVAQQMVNFAYVIGDRGKGEAVLVDPAYGVADLTAVVESEGMKVVGALATHHHPDHVGGTMMGHSLEGVAELDVPIHVHKDEAAFVQRVTGVSATDLVEHVGGDTIMVGDIPIDVLHTPGHTPGSMCFLVGGVLVSGDTLFLEGCGRTDFPGSDPGAMYDSLTRLATLPDDTVVCSGHWYSQPPIASLGEVKEGNYVLKPRTKEAWLLMFGGQ
jgi:glyoxylase-like metal-dependent hydrolase (beta-lactamase superfamily II)